MRSAVGQYTISILTSEDFRGGPVVENQPSIAGDMGSIPGWGAKIPQAVGQLSPWDSTREKPLCCNKRYRMLKLRPSTAKKKKNNNNLKRGL